MITSTPKKFENILENLKGEEKIFLLGCGDCATICHTGDEEACKAMKALLEKHGKTVTGMIVLTPACNVSLIKKEFKVHKDEVEAADSVLVMSCGLCVQAAIDAIGSKIVHPANDTGFGGETKRLGHFEERCSMCGECVLEDTGGICPVTMCSKGLLNGPCGGYSADGKCEVNPELDCGWLLIYKRLQEINKKEKMTEYREPKNNSKWQRPRKLVLDNAVRLGKDVLIKESTPEPEKEEKK